MQISAQSKVASLLPRLTDRVPGQDCFEEVITKTTGYIDNIVDPCSSQKTPCCWKLASLPPLQLADTSSVDCHLVKSLLKEIYLLGID